SSRALIPAETAGWDMPSRVAALPTPPYSTTATKNRRWLNFIELSYEPTSTLFILFITRQEAILESALLRRLCGPRIVCSALQRSSALSPTPGTIRGIPLYSHRNREQRRTHSFQPP